LIWLGYIGKSIHFLLIQLGELFVIIPIRLWSDIDGTPLLLRGLAVWNGIDGRVLLDIVAFTGCTMQSVGYHCLVWNLKEVLPSPQFLVYIGVAKPSIQTLLLATKRSIRSDGQHIDWGILLRLESKQTVNSYSGNGYLLMLKAVK
jgi:hypothetical protein